MPTNFLPHTRGPPLSPWQLSIPPYSIKFANPNEYYVNEGAATRTPQKVCTVCAVHTPKLGVRLLTGISSLWSEIFGFVDKNRSYM